MIPKVERPGHMQCDLFLLRFARLGRRRRYVCGGCVSVLRVLGLGSSLGFVDGCFEGVINAARATGRHTEQRSITAGARVVIDNLPDMCRYGLRRVIELYHSVTEGSEELGDRREDISADSLM